MSVTVSFQPTGPVPGNAGPVTMSGSSLTIGRGPANDLVLPDPDRMLSKSHCVIEDQGGNVVVIDLSTNGTFLNYAKVPLGPVPTPLSNGDVLTLGVFELVVSIGAMAPSALDLGPDPLGDYPVSPGRAELSPDPLDLLDSPGEGGDVLDELLGGASVPTGPAQLNPVDPIDELLPPDGAGDDDPFFRPPADGREGQGASFGAHSPSASDSFTPPSPGRAIIPDDWDDFLAPTPAQGGGEDGLPGTDEPVPPVAPLDDPFAEFDVPPPAAAPARRGASDVPDALPDVPPAAAPVTPPAQPPLAPSGQPPLTPAAQPPLTPPAEPPVASPGATESEAPRDPTAVPRPPHANAPPPPTVPTGPLAAPAATSPAAPSTPAAPTPPPAAPASAGDRAAVRAFLDALGADDMDIRDEDLPETMARAGAIMRELVTGIREILMTRTSIKSEFRIEQTMIAAGGNNPLKFSVSPDQAVEALLRPRRRGYMAPEAAAREALDDIAAHEVAMVAGMESAIRSVLGKLSPAVLSDRIESSGLLGGILRGGRKAQYWDIYEKMFAEISDQAENDFHHFFSREFAKAYQEQLNRLKARDDQGQDHDRDGIAPPAGPD